MLSGKPERGTVGPSRVGAAHDESPIAQASVSTERIDQSEWTERVFMDDRICRLGIVLCLLRGLVINEGRVEHQLRRRHFDLLNFRCWPVADSQPTAGGYLALSPNAYGALTDLTAAMLLFNARYRWSARGGGAPGDSIRNRGTTPAGTRGPAR